MMARVSYSLALNSLVFEELAHQASGSLDRTAAAAPDSA